MNLKNGEKKINRNYSTYETNKHTYDFGQFEGSFGDSIFSCRITISETEKDQSNYQKILQSLMINLDQEQKKERYKK